MGPLARATALVCLPVFAGCVDLSTPARLAARAGPADGGGEPAVDAAVRSPDRPVLVGPDGPAVPEDAPVQPPSEAGAAPEASAGPETELAVDAPTATPDAPVVQGCAAPATACSQAGVLLCDGFETSSAGKFPLWNSVFVKNPSGSPANPGTAALVADTRVCRGGKAFQPHLVGPSQQVYVEKGFSPLPSPVYVRFFLYLPSGVALPTKVADFSNGPDYLELHIDDGNSLFVGRTYDKTLDQFPTPLPRDRWFCLEWMLKANSKTDGEIKLSIDGVVVGDHAGIDTTMPSGAPSTLLLGAIFTPTTTPAATITEIYMDEVVVSSAPVGCR